MPPAYQNLVATHLMIHDSERCHALQGRSWNLAPCACKGKPVSGQSRELCCSGTGGELCTGEQAGTGQCQAAVPGSPGKAKPAKAPATEPRPALMGLQTSSGAVKYCLDCVNTLLLGDLLPGKCLHFCGWACDNAALECSQPCLILISFLLLSLQFASSCGPSCLAEPPACSPYLFPVQNQSN